MLDRLTNHPILPQVLIWALLLCHGAFGSLHTVADLVVADPAPAALSAGGHATIHHTSGHHDGGAGHDERQTRHTGAEYFAVLLSIFFGGLALRVLLRNAPRRHATSSATRRSRSMPPAVFSLPRGPTLPLLQVFRL